MQEEGKLKPVRASKFETIITDQKLLMETGLIAELAKSFKNEKKRVDLQRMLEMYMKLYPETALPPKKEKKKKDGKKQGVPEMEPINPVELVTDLIDELILIAVLAAEEKEKSRLEEQRLKHEATKKARLRAKYGDQIDEKDEELGEEEYLMEDFEDEELYDE